MAPKIKLQRVGAKNQPKYRVVVQEAREKLNGKVIAVLGIYHPKRDAALFGVDEEKILAWIKKGATPTEKLRILFSKTGILPPINLSALPKRKKKGEPAAPKGEPGKDAEAKTEAKEEPPPE